ncbi:hypothetical protein CHS0354_012192 [Potamilus streckersoni]|uniref:Uncharacterized protein n=1 Tax=Potamilus streckersoni TaxID=2493646 RepID=A0AAE0VT71_9BIVA|nr:hypothetical protein CHS0354_012192 [Potamilus streckersoni]
MQDTSPSSKGTRYGSLHTGQHISGISQLSSPSSWINMKCFGYEKTLSPKIRPTSPMSHVRKSSSRRNLEPAGANCELEGANCELEGENCELEGANCKLEGANCELEGANYELEGANCELEGEN